jgi:hypothetical protein
MFSFAALLKAILALLASLLTSLGLWTNPIIEPELDQPLPLCGEAFRALYPNIDTPSCPTE